MSESRSIPAISIVLPTYNGAKHIRQSIDSILDQTFNDWELVIVDDSSTDETPDIISQYCRDNAKIRTIRNEINRKLPGSLNEGFNITRAPFLSWTSDDNAYRPEALSELYSFLQAHPETGLVYSGYSLIDSAGRVTGEIHPVDYKMLWRWNVIGGCFLYRRNIYETIGGYDESSFVVEDYDYWLRVACIAKIDSLDKNLYLYREHEGTLTSKFYSIRADLTEKVQRRHLENLPFADKSILQKAYRRYVHRAIERPDYPTAFKRFLKLLSIAPAGSVLWLAEYLIKKALIKSRIPLFSKLKLPLEQN